MDNAFGITIDFDELAKLQDKLNIAPKVMANAINSALSSASYFMMQRLKAAAKTNEFGWKDLVMHPSGKTLSQIVRANPPKKGEPFKMPGGAKGKFWGSVINLIRYKVNKEKLGAGIGVLGFNPKTGALARDLQTEHEVQKSGGNTIRRQNYFGFLGFPVRRDSGFFQTPQRELFANVMEKYTGAVNGLLTTVISDKLTKGFEKGDGTPFDDLLSLEFS